MADLRFQHLPPQVLHEILLLVTQADLAALASTCSQLHLIASELLYSSIVVIPDVAVALNRNKIGYNGPCLCEPTYGTRSVAGSLQVRDIAKAQAMVSTLRNNPALVSKITSFAFPCTYSTSQVCDLQHQCHRLFKKHASRMIHYDVGVYLDCEKHKDNIEQGQLGCTEVSIAALAHLSRIASTNHIQKLTLSDDLASYHGLDLSDPSLEFLYEIPALEFSANCDYGLDILDTVDCGKFKLHPTLFSVRHEHGTTPENPDIHRCLDFQVLESKVDLAQLSLLSLDISCVEHYFHENEEESECVDQFLEDFTDFLVQQGGLPCLNDFRLILPHAEDWMAAFELLERIVSPVTTLIKTMANLHKLNFSLSVHTFKMFCEGGMSPVLLNHVNTRILEAFILSLGPAMDTLTELELPDLLTSFFFYKPQFMESLLHTCKCRGCKKVLVEVERQFMPINDEDVADEESAYYVIVGFILDKLHLERQLVKPFGKKATPSHCALYKGTQGILESNFGRQTPLRDEKRSGERGTDVSRGLETVREAGRSTDVEKSFSVNLEQLEADTGPAIVDPRENLASAELTHCSSFARNGEIPGCNNDREPANGTTGETTGNEPTEANETTQMAPADDSKPPISPAGTRPVGDFDMDTLVSTYILHQTQPIVGFLMRALPKLERLMVHGLYFEKKNNHFVSVFDLEEYPDQWMQKAADVNGDELFGQWNFA